MFRGRELLHPERGESILLRLADELKELAVVESRPNLDGRNMVMMLAPVKNPPPAGAAGEAPVDDAEAPADAAQAPADAAEAPADAAEAPAAEGPAAEASAAEAPAAPAEAEATAS
jgi:translation initiation factor IF-3